MEETVESMYRQNLKIPFEIVISDDNSQDDTQELIKKLAKKYPEIKYHFNKKNLRAPNNRNSAIAKSRGDVIYMSCHDNVLGDNTIQKLINTVQNTEFEVASVQEQIFFKIDTKKLKNSWIHNFSDNIFTLKEYTEQSNTPAASINFLFTRKAFDKTKGYPDLNGRENFGFSLRLLARGLNIAIVPNTKYFHRIVADGLFFTEFKNKEKYGKDMITALKEHIDCFDEKTQKLINSKKSYKKIDEYIKRNKLKLSEKGWKLTGKKIKHQNINNSIIHKLKNKVINYSKNKLNQRITKIFLANNEKGKEKFNENYFFYKKIYREQKNNLKKLSSPFLLPNWIDFGNEIENYFFNSFKINFFSHKIVTNTMFIKPKWQKLQLNYLEKKYKTEKLKKYLSENKYGHPLICSPKYRTSANSIHHLNHLSLFEDKTKCNLKNTKNVVEWGGGYGNMAKIFLRIKPEATYSIIDLPIFVFIQAIYLSCILGKNKINIVTEQNPTIKDNLINLIPLNEKILNDIDFHQPDIFISTWALSESNNFSQNFVERLNYFNSKKLLIAHQVTSPSMPHASDIANKMDKYNILYHEKINYISGENYYLFSNLKKEI
ncbi:putative sugar O-methyltransferase [Candidatus Parcubacteria bacterium]|nr:putative sugar O-methyltransferase [Candidatus Parcubacteria bacterium]